MFIQVGNEYYNTRFITNMVLKEEGLKINFSKDMDVWGVVVKDKNEIGSILNKLNPMRGV